MPSIAETQVFTGENALKTYLDPSNGSYTPLVELPPALNPFHQYNVHIHAKLLNALPLGNVKSIPAFHMLSGADRQTQTRKIIESSSGNTVASLGVLAPHFGFAETHALVSHEVTPGKLKMLQLMGVYPIINREPICPSEHDQTSGIQKARRMGRHASWLNLDQYSNPRNSEAHAHVTGPQLWRQRQGQIDYLFASMGTTGTLLGTSRYLKTQKPDLKTIGIVRAPNNPVPGPRTRHLLNDVSLPWRDACDDLVEAGTVESFQHSLNMIRQGLMVGPSSGMAYAGLLRYLDNKRDLLTNRCATHCVFICCDNAIPYMDEYFKYLPENAFPSVKNQHLLANPRLAVTPQATPDTMTAAALYQAVQDNQPIKLIDLRSPEHFHDYHIAQAVNIPENDFMTHITTLARLYQNKTSVLICEQGTISDLLTPYAMAKNMPAVSLTGGMIEWSRQNLPRVKSASCPL